MVKNPEFPFIVPLEIPHLPVKKRLRKRSIPKKFDFDKQRFEKYSKVPMPQVVPFKRGRLGRIIMLEAA